MRKLFKVVLSHLPEDIKEPLRKQKFDAIPIEDCLPTIFNYIKFWRYLDLGFVENMIALCNIKESHFISAKIRKINNCTIFIRYWSAIANKSPRYVWSDDYC